jgi:hypothetical protein
MTMASASLIPDENIGESKHAVLEEAGVGFDPTTQHMDLSKEEKRRTTALLMAIQAYNNLIIKDAEMYIAISRESHGKADDDGGPIIRPATMNAIVIAAIQFDDFISGKVAARMEKKEKEASDELTQRTENL